MKLPLNVNAAKPLGKATFSMRRLNKFPNIMVRRLLGERLSTQLVKKLTGKNLNKRYGRLTPPEHVYSFTEKSLSRLLQSAGFDILKVYKPAWGDPTWFPMANRQDFSLTERAFFLLDQLGARLGFGDVIVVLARKKQAAPT